MGTNVRPARQSREIGGGVPLFACLPACLSVCLSIYLSLRCLRSPGSSVHQKPGPTRKGMHACMHALCGRRAHRCCSCCEVTMQEGPHDARSRMSH